MPSSTNDPIAVARSFLFAPGNRPERFDKASNAGADLVILDLEDSVPADEKDAARRQVSRRLDHSKAVVRINAADSDWHAQDLREISQKPHLMAVMVPKSAPDSVAAAIAAVGGRVPIIALVESATGILECATLARTAGVGRLAFGNLDYRLSLGLTEPSHDERELLFARSTLVVASAAAGLPGPIDGVHPATRDTEGLQRATESARALGFTGKLCIHPSQVDEVNRLHYPDAQTIDWARRVAAEELKNGGAAALLEGEMLDAPQYQRARLIIERADQHPSPVKRR